MPKLNSNEAPVEVECEYAASLDQVWKAITDPNLMQQWYFAEIEEFEPTPDFATQFTVEADGRDFVHVWKVTEADPPNRIRYDWSYLGIQGASTICWQLAATDNGTSLKISHTAVEDFPDDDPLFSRESCQAGWEYFLHEQLADHLTSAQ